MLNQTTTIAIFLIIFISTSSAAHWTTYWKPGNGRTRYSEANTGHGLSDYHIHRPALRSGGFLVETMDHQSDMETDSSQNSFQQEWSNEELDLLEKLIRKLKMLPSTKK